MRVTALILDQHERTGWLYVPSTLDPGKYHSITCNVLHVQVREEQAAGAKYAGGINFTPVRH
jgi:hypothetical protein